MRRAGSARGGRRRSCSGSALAVALAAALPALYLVVVVVGERAVAADAVFTTRSLGLVVRSLGLAAAVTAGAIAIAVPLAWLTVRSDLPGRRGWATLATLPLVMPSYIAAYVFVAVLRPKGLLQELLAPLGVSELPPIYGFVGAWLVLTLCTYPLVLIPLRAALRRLDPALEEAARVMGRSPLEVFRTVVLPQLAPAIGAGRRARRALRAQRLRRGRDPALRLVHARDLHRVPVGAADRGRGARDGARRRHARPVRGLRAGARRARAAPHEPRHAAPAGARAARALALAGARVLLGRRRGRRSCCRSGCSSTGRRATCRPASTPARPRRTPPTRCSPRRARPPPRRPRAIVVAVLSVRFPGYATRAIERVGYAGYALPGIVVALALVFFGTRVALPLYQTLAMLVFALSIHYLPLAVGPISGALLQVPPRLEEAARGLGRTPLQVFRTITRAARDERRARGRGARVPARDEGAAGDAAARADRLRHARDRHLPPDDDRASSRPARSRRSSCCSSPRRPCTFSTRRA